MTKQENKNNEIVSLLTPIIRGEKEFKEIEVYRPTVIALKGLKLLDLMQSDVDSVITLLQKVTKPQLHKADFEKMNVADFTALSIALMGFLAPTSIETETETKEA